MSAAVQVTGGRESRSVWGWWPRSSADGQRGRAVTAHYVRRMTGAGLDELVGWEPTHVVVDPLEPAGRPVTYWVSAERPAGTASLADAPVPVQRFVTEHVPVRDVAVPGPRR